MWAIFADIPVTCEQGLYFRKVNIYRRLRIGRDVHLDQSGAYHI